MTAEKWEVFHDHETGQFSVGPPSALLRPIVATHEIGTVIASVHNATLVPAPAPTDTEACESRNADCGPVVWHDYDGTAMCAKCLIATVAENTAALSATRRTTQATDLDGAVLRELVEDAHARAWTDAEECADAPRQITEAVLAAGFARPATGSAEAVIEYVSKVLGDVKYGHDIDWARANLRPAHLREVALAPIAGTPAESQESTEADGDREGDR